MKTALQNLLLVVVSVMACVVFGEIAVRVLIKPPPLVNMSAAEEGLRKIIVFDDRLESRYRPGSRATIRSQYGEFEISYEINELGLRDRPLSMTHGGRRILILGNSLAEGWGVPAEKSFVREAERRLAESSRGDPTPRLINAGISGYGAAQSYLLFQDLRERVRADAVVFVYVSTMVHFDNNYLSRAELDGAGLATGLSVDALLKGGGPGGNAPASSTTISPPMRTLAEYSALARLLILAVIAREERERIRAGDPATDLLAGTRANSGDLPKLHEPSLRHVAAIADLAAKSRMPFMIVHLPLPHQLSARAWGKGRVAYGLEEKIYDAPDKAVVDAFCLRAQMSCVAAHDSLQRLMAGPAQSKLFFDYDFHPNEEGNAVLGSWLAEQLASRPSSR